MPFVHISIAGASLSASEIATLQSEATRLMAEVMDKRAGLTAVLVEFHEPRLWSIGGQSVTAAAHLDVKVTAGTNDMEQKASFIRQAHDLLASTVGAGLPVATYVVVDEVEADAWGYGGLSQAARRKGLA